jgi:hypothetical protein
MPVVQPYLSTLGHDKFVGSRALAYGYRYATTTYQRNPIQLSATFGLTPNSVREISRVFVRNCWSPPELFYHTCRFHRMLKKTAAPCKSAAIRKDSLHGMMRGN